MPKIIDLEWLQSGLIDPTNQSVLNRKWTVELGHSRNPLLRKTSFSMSDFEQISARSRSNHHHTNLQLSFREPHERERNPKREESNGYIDFASSNKPLKDLMFNAQDEKCYILLDKGAEVSTSENKKEKVVLSESGLLMLVDVNDSKKQGVKNIQFNSMIQIKSELDFNLKLEFECENVDRVVLDLERGKHRHVPVKYYRMDTNITVTDPMDRLNHPMDELGIENEIKFSSFLADKQQFTQLTNYYSQDKKNWGKIVEKDTILTILVPKFHTQDKKHRVSIAVSIYRRKVPIANRGNQKETAHVFLIVFRPLMVIQNNTPKKLELSINNLKQTPQLEPNEKFIYNTANTIDESTTLKADFKESTSCKLYDNKGIKLTSVCLVSEKDSHNRVYLKIEIRRHSSNHLSCFIYCPFLIYNETRFDLSYKSSVYKTKFEKIKGGRDYDVTENWKEAMELQQEDNEKQLATEEDNSFDSSESLSDSRIQDTPLDDFYTKIVNSFDMYCPERVTQRLKISIGKGSDNWSNPFVLRFKESSSFLIKQTEKESLLDQNPLGKKKVASINKNKKKSHIRHKFKFIVYVDQMSGFLSRSKLIVIQPFYIIKNEDDSMSIALTQFDLLDHHESIRPGSSITFNWPKRDSEEFLVLAQIESASNTLVSEWSRKFPINQLGQFTVKVPKAGHFEYMNVNIYRDENSPYYITIRKATMDMMPLKIVNETKYDMNVSQVFLNKSKKVDSSIPKGEVVRVKANDRVMFAWDENCPPRILKVQVEDIEQIYNMDNIKDLPPIPLKQGLTNMETQEVKQYLRSYLKRRNIYDDRDDFKEQYCILNYSKLEMKIYPNNSDYPTIIKLPDAQIDEDFQKNEFMLVYNKETYYFQCKNSAECKLWVESLVKAKNLNKEDTVDPINLDIRED